METKLPQSERAETVLADHEVMEQYIENINRMFNSGSAQATKVAIGEIKRFLNSTLVAHFDYEEQGVFPVLLQSNADPEISRFVSELREEHESLTKEAKRLNDMFSNQELIVQPSDSLRMALVNFFYRLRQHASKENKVFPSLL